MHGHSSKCSGRKRTQPIPSDPIRLALSISEAFARVAFQCERMLNARLRFADNVVDRDGLSASSDSRLSDATGVEAAHE